MSFEFTSTLPSDLRNRFELIIQTVPDFWKQKRYKHFTNHGPNHSSRVQRQKLAQLVRELPDGNRLTNDEAFVLASAAWLYEIGMQSPNLKSVLGYDCRAGDPLSFSQLQQIRDKKHLLTEQLILESVRSHYQGAPLPLGLTRPLDDHTRLIATVCRWCSDEPLEDVPELLPIDGLDVRVRLLVALLRLADQLYIHRSRVDLDLLQQRTDLPRRQFARWWAYHYTQTRPIVNGQIRFFYRLPVTQKSCLGHIRALIELPFTANTNPTIRYMWHKYNVRLKLDETAGVEFEQPRRRSEMRPDLVKYLRREVAPLEIDYETRRGTIRTELRTERGERVIKILFLAANPSDTTRLRVDEESRAIDDSLRKAEFRDYFDIRPHFAVRVSDLQALLLRHQPDIVHFSGHGSKLSEIILEDRGGRGKAVSPHDLSTVFAVLKDNIRCVVLNACYSDPQARAIAEHIDCVVGMSDSIGDASAIHFASAFYQALGFGKDVKTAFASGCAEIGLEGSGGQDVPKLLCTKCDPQDVFFVKP